MITVAELKAALRIDTLEDAYEEEAQVTRLEQLEEAAVAFIERYTGRGFGPQDEEAQFVVRGYGTSTLLLPEYVSAVTAVSSRSYRGDTETVIEPDADDGWALALTPGKTHGIRLERAGGGGWDTWQEYVVTATAGYEAGNEPPDIRTAVIALVGLWFERAVPVESTPVAELPLHVREMLAPWKRLVL